MNNEFYGYTPVCVHTYENEHWPELLRGNKRPRSLRSGEAADTLKIGEMSKQS